MKNLLRTVIDNGRLAALPEIATQFHALVNARSGVSDAVVYSAFPIDGALLDEVVGALEKRFGRKLNASVEVEPELIGGIKRRGRRRGARHLGEGPARTNEGGADRVSRQGRTARQLE